MQFIGWNTRTDGSGTHYAPGSVITLVKDTTLWAQWDKAENVWYVIYDANGGKPDTVPNKISAPKDTRIRIPGQELSWDKNHIFLGWSIDPKATEPEWVPGDTVLFDKDTILYAVWEVRYTITYKLNGGTYSGSKEDITETYKAGTEIKIHAAPVREGYTFLYWKGSEYRPGDKYTVTKDHTFEAQWKKKSGPAPTPAPDDPSGGSTPAKTGDNSNTALWLVLMITSLMGAAATIYLRCRKNEQG